MLYKIIGFTKHVCRRDWTLWPQVKPSPKFLHQQQRIQNSAFHSNRVCTKSKSPSQSLPKRTFINSIVRSMNGDGCEDNDNGEAELSGAFNQEEQNPLFGGSTAASNGLHSAVNRLSKWLVAVLFIATVLGRHDAESLWAAMGSVLNSAFSVVLKRILNQERPNSAISSGPGMPSSHAQSIFYTVVFVIWSLIEWLEVNYLAVVLSTMALACGSYFSWLRVSQQYHTTSQVAVGAAVGSAFGILWLWSWQAFVVRAYMSSLWVRLIVIVASLVFCLCFLVHIVRDWLRDVQ